jgi:hypothetical protein
MFEADTADRRLLVTHCSSSYRARKSVEVAATAAAAAAVAVATAGIVRKLVHAWSCTTLAQLWDALVTGLAGMCWQHAPSGLAAFYHFAGGGVRRTGSAVPHQPVGPVHHQTHKRGRRGPGLRGGRAGRQQ